MSVCIYIYICIHMVAATNTGHGSVELAPILEIVGPY